MRKAKPAFVCRLPTMNLKTKNRGAESAMSGPGMHRRARALLVFSLALLASWTFVRAVVLSGVEPRVRFARQVLAGDMDAPYQYRVLHPLLVRSLELTLKPICAARAQRHVIASAVILLVAFTGAYAFFYGFLRTLYEPAVALCGVLLVHSAVPQAITGYIADGDWISLCVFAVGLNCIARHRDGWLPVLMVIGTLNREQTVFLVVFYLCFLAHQRRLRERRGQFVLAASLAGWAWTLAGLYAWFGPRSNPYTVGWVVAHNANWGTLWRLTGPLWLSEFGGLTVLALFAWARSNRFFRLGLVAVAVYAVLFFFSGILIELAKFLPALLVLIPMALQPVTGRFAEDGWPARQ